MKALVADDSAVQRKKIASSLSQCGVKVDEAADGEEALLRLRDNPNYTILVTDWNMPKMDGLCLVREVRADPKLEGIPILMVTTENDPWSVTRAIRSGANEYLMKPFDREALRDKLLNMLGPHHRLFGGSPS